MTKNPEESRLLREELKEKHDRLPPMTDDGIELTPEDGAAILGDLDIRPIEPPPAGRRGVSAGARSAEEKETTASSEDSVPEAPDAQAAAEVSREWGEEPPTPRAIFGTDSRKLYSPTTMFPNRAVCHLVVTYPWTPAGSAWVGTGNLIGGKHVLTAGHVLYKHAEGGWAKTVRVIPGRDGDKWPFGSEFITSPKIRSVTGWTEDADMDYDYALLTLNNGFPTLGSFGLAYFSNDTLDSTTAYLIGYPGVPPKAYPGYNNRQFGVPQGGGLTDYDSDLVYYAMDTSRGQSGAGVYRFWNDKRAIFAVHGGQYDGDENRAARITKTRHDLIRLWQMEDGLPG